MLGAVDSICTGNADPPCHCGRSGMPFSARMFQLLCRSSGRTSMAFVLTCAISKVLAILGAAEGGGDLDTT